MKLLIWIGTTMAALAVAAWLFDGISVEGATWTDKLLPLALASVILGLVGAVVKPVLKFFSFPVILLTLGLFLLVINALMLLLTSWFAEKFEIGFHVEGFWTALFASIVITLTTALIDSVVGDGDD